jgi:ribonucleoside-diphosphate reductase alpha chain
LNFYGIKSNIKFSETKASFPNGKDYDKLYKRYDLTISGKHLAKFARVFELSNKDKNDKLKDILDIDIKDTSYANDRNYLVVKSVELTERYEDVYDITVFDNTHTFLMETGITGNCGELPLGLDSCRLLVINLLSFVNNPFTKKAEFDYDLFASVSQKAQRLMDDLIDLEIEKITKIIEKIKADPEPEDVKSIELKMWEQFLQSCQQGRRTGTGITALGDCLAALNIKYGSKKSIDMTGEIYRQLMINTYKSSSIMAEERGAFPIFDAAMEKDHPFISYVLAQDSELKKLYRKSGRRNVALLTTAPTGSVSTQTQTTSGIEPAYMLSYKRRKKINPSDKDARVDFTDPMGDKWQEFMVYHHGVKQWMEITGETDITKSPYHNATANDVDWSASVDLQAAAQKSVDHSISKTCNVPNNATEELISEVYMKAWETGCKGFTVYRDGCRAGVLISNEPKQETKTDTRPTTVLSILAPKRPNELICDIKKSKIQGESWTFFVGLFDGKPYEIFGGLSKYVDIPNKYKQGRIVKNGKVNNNSTYNLIIGDGDDQMVIKDIASVFENAIYGSFTRTLSLALRHGTPVQYVVEQLQKDKHSDITSFATVISRVFKQYIADGAKTNQQCPTCKADNSLVYQEGCMKCLQCSFSKC